MLTLDFDLALVFSGLCEIIGKLHPQPRFRCAAKGLREADRHLRADPRLAVDDVVERLSGDAQDLRSLRDGQAQGFKACAPYDTSGMCGILDGHGVVPLFRLVIVDQFNVKRIPALKAENNAPVRPNGNRPKPLKIAFERMKAVTGQVKFL